MAKRKTTRAAPAATPEKPPRPAPAKADRREMILSLKGSAEWNAWFGELAARCRATKSGLVDRALMELAERIEFRPPPER